MRPVSGRGMPLLVLALTALAGILLLAGCMTTAPSPVPGTTPVVTTPAVPSYAVHVPGNNHGMVLLVGMNTCPHCRETKDLLANLSVDYYWIDLNNLDEAKISTVMQSVRVCKDTKSVPMLIINGDRCIIGYNEKEIREALG